MKSLAMAFAVVLLLGSTALAQCGCAPAMAAPAMPAVSYYAPAPTVTYYAPAPAVTTYYAPAPTVTYYTPPAPTVAYYPGTAYTVAAPVAVAPSVVYPSATVVARPLYVPGQPVRNFFRGLVY